MSDRAVAQIRVATPADAHGLGRMHVTSWRETYAGLLPGGFRLLPDARLDDPDLLAHVEANEWVGNAVELAPVDNVNLVKS